MRRIEATGHAGDYSVEIFNDHYAAMPPEAVARMAMAMTEKLFAQV